MTDSTHSHTHHTCPKQINISAAPSKSKKLLILCAYINCVYDVIRLLLRPPRATQLGIRKWLPPPLPSRTAKTISSSTAFRPSSRSASPRYVRRGRHSRTSGSRPTACGSVCLFHLLYTSGWLKTEPYVLAMNCFACPFITESIGIRVCLSATC